MSVSVPRWVLFCEAAADARRVQQIVDELLRLHGEPWLCEVLDSTPESQRSWWSDAPASSEGWFDLHAYQRIARDLRIAPRYGHFDGEAAEPDAAMFAMLFRITRALAKKAPKNERPTAVVVLRDQDDDPAGRSKGAAQALAQGELPEDIKVVLGLPIPEREAWVLAGFDPLNPTETSNLETARAELGFYPNREAHRLSSGDSTNKTDAKRIVLLLGIDDSREEQCTKIPSTERRNELAERGRLSGLAAFLTEVEDRLVSQVDPSATARIAKGR